MSEFASLDPSLPHGLGHYEVVTVGFVDNGRGKPHVKVGQDKPGDHGLVAQNNDEVDTDHVSFGLVDLLRLVHTWASVSQMISPKIEHPGELSSRGV